MGPDLDYTSRPYPAAGSAYELELYLAVSACVLCAMAVSFSAFAFSAVFRWVLKAAFPRPPRPPLAAKNRSPGALRSASAFPSRSMSVPMGTGTVQGVHSM